MKYCQQCGAQLEEEMKFCVYCGASAEDSANAQQEQNPWNNYNSSHQSQETYGQNRSEQNGQNMNCQNNGFQNNNAAGYGQMPGPYGGGIHGIERRSIPLSVILTIVTCGLYGLYWIIKLNDEINQLAGEPNATSSGMVILLSIVTCGIYEFYWLYKMGERGDKIKGVNSSSGILYIVIAILGLSIVDLCLIQDTGNKKVGN